VTRFVISAITAVVPPDSSPKPAVEPFRTLSASGYVIPASERFLLAWSDPFLDERCSELGFSQLEQGKAITNFVILVTKSRDPPYCNYTQSPLQ
jgi:hypothetical protein